MCKLIVARTGRPFWLPEKAGSDYFLSLFGSQSVHSYDSVWHLSQQVTIYCVPDALLSGDFPKGGGGGLQ